MEQFFTDMKSPIHRFLDNKTRVVKVYTLLLLIMPIIDQYRFSPLTNFEIFCVIFGLIYLFRHTNLSDIGSFAGYYCVLIVGAFASSLGYGEGLLRSGLSACRLAAIFIGIFVGAKQFFSFEYAKVMLKRIALLVSASIFLQMILFYVFDIATFWVIPNAVLNYNGGILGQELISALSASVNGGYIFRPMSVFLEPSFCGYYLVPAVALMLFSEKRISIRPVVCSLIITIATILTTSMVGIVAVVVLWVLYLIHCREMLANLEKKYIWGVAAVVVIGVCLLFSQEAVQFSIIRKIAQLATPDASSSTSMRLFRGLDYFMNMQPMDMVFGCGFGHLEDYYFQYGLENKMMYIISEVSYMNSISAILCSSGVVGLLFYLFGAFSYFKSGNKITKILVTLLLMLICAGAYGDLASYYVLVSLIISSKQEKIK